MKKYFGFGVMILASIFVVSSVQVASSQEAAGKQLFLDKKCNMCHSVESQAIAKKGAASAEKKVPDLSNIGGEHNAEWIGKFLKKEVDLEGKKHQKAWTGTDDEFKKLVDWLATLKKS